MDVKDIKAQEIVNQVMASKKGATPERKKKTYTGEWYSVNSVFGCDWARLIFLLGGREAGKSYSAMQWGVNRKLKLGDKFKFYWFRLTEAAANNLTADGGAKFIDPDLQRKYGIKTFSKNNIVYTYEEQEHVRRDGTVVKEKINKKEFCTILACSTFYNTKGVGYFDNEFDGEYYLILDEMNREESEKNNFDIVYNFVNLLENVIRSTKTKIRVVCIGNTLSESSDLLSALNFLPPETGRYYLKKKHCVIDYIAPNEKYRERRKDTFADNLLPDASTFTNEIDIDYSLIVNKRKAISPQYIIKCNKSKGTWFTVWNGNIVKPYNNEEGKQVIAMRKYLDSVYTMEGFNMVFDIFNARGYYYTNIATFKRLQRELKLLKK